MLIIFVLRAAAAISVPGWVWGDLYVAGGLIFAAYLIWRGVRLWTSNS